MSKCLTFLFFPRASYGQINCCHGVAEVLRDRNHRVVFAIDAAFGGKLTQYGFEEEVYSLEEDLSTTSEDKRTGPDFVSRHSQALRSVSPEYVFENFIAKGLLFMAKRTQQFDSKYAQIISKVKPDLILVDITIGCPALTHSGIPWVWIVSSAPHKMYSSDKIPPICSGLPLNDKNGWKEFEKKRNELLMPVTEIINNFYNSKNVANLPANKYHPESPYLNIYMYPKELDYDQLVCLPNNFVRVEAAVRTTNEQFSIPESLLSKPGKLIFLSMGSLGSGDIELMIRLTAILSKSANRFIVSKGAGHAKYELPDNMWGQRMVAQTKVLPLVELVIHHGGNNTLTETFYFGKPMIIMPLFGDQLDNAQRVAELGYGLRLSPYHCTEQQLLNAVDEILSNESLTAKMKSIGERIRNSDYMEKVCDRIESCVK